MAGQKSARRRGYHWRPTPVADEIGRLGQFIGNTVKVAGIVFQGEGMTWEILLPDADILPVYARNTIVYQASSGDWMTLLKTSDDPHIFQGDEKPWIRKAEYALQGHVQQKIWKRDGFRCMYCGCGFGDARLMTIDHFIPLESGGSNFPDNLISSCDKCNRRKGSSDPYMFCLEHNYDYDGLCIWITARNAGQEVDLPAHLEGIKLGLDR